MHKEDTYITVVKYKEKDIYIYIYMVKENQLVGVLMKSCMFYWWTRGRNINHRNKELQRVDSSVIPKLLPKATPSHTK